MELVQLQAFVAVAEAGGFSRAASQRIATQPTLSRQVAALESELGALLFDRLGRRIELTNFGRECLDKARGILSAIDELSASGKAKSERVSGLLRIACADSVVMRRFPAVLQRFQAKYPGVRIRVRTGASPEILELVRDGLVDAALAMLPGSYPELTMREVWTDEFIAIAPPGHRLAGKSIDLPEFSGETHITIQEGTMSQQSLVAAFQKVGLSFVPDMSFDNFQLIVDLVSAGMGVGIASKLVSEQALENGEVERIHVEGVDGLRRSLGLAVHAERVMDGALAAFCSELEAER